MNTRYIFVEGRCTILVSSIKNRGKTDMFDLTTVVCGRCARGARAIAVKPGAVSIYIYIFVQVVLWQFYR